MRIIMYVTFPTEQFNAALRQGSVGAKIKSILEETKPEAVYFGERSGGERGAVVVVDVAAAADLPAVSEPWYLAFGARVEARIAMTAEEVAGLSLDALADKYD